MTKAEAAAYLNVSDRAINRYTAAGKLSVRYQKRPGGHQVGVYDREQVKKLKRQLEAPPPPRPEPAKESKVLVRRTTDDSDTVAMIIRQLIESSLPTMTSVVPITARLTLSLTDASELSGLSEYYLLEAIKSGDLSATKRGPHGSWNIKRDDLESWVAKL